MSNDSSMPVASVAKSVPDPVVTELPGIILPEKSIALNDRVIAQGALWKENHITEENFPFILEAGPRKLILLFFPDSGWKYGVSTLRVESWADTNGYQSARLEELIAVGMHPTYGVLARKFPIMALGASVTIEKYRRVACLHEGDVPTLHLRKKGVKPPSIYANKHSEWEWDPNTRFLLVKD